VKLRRLLPALFLLTLSGCSTPPVIAPSEIPPPPAVLTIPCTSPDALPDMATAKELAESLAQWMHFGGCELFKHNALLEAWPK
jgi:hypothetical protein